MERIGHNTAMLCYDLYVRGQSLSYEVLLYLLKHFCREVMQRLPYLAHPLCLLREAMVCSMQACSHVAC